MKTKNKRNKIKKKSSEIIKKLNYYFFYLRKYPQALIKSPFYLLRYGPKKFWQKVKKVEKIVELINPQWSFHFLQFLSPEKIIKAIKILFTKGPKGVIEKIQELKWQNYHNLSINQQYQIWLKKNYPTKKELERQKKESKKFKYQPKISLITPVYNPEKKHLIECIESVLNQSYPNWELCLVDDASTKKYVKEVLNNYSKKDKRIKVKFRDKNGHICVASNDALKMAKGEYIGLLDHDDFLWPNALYEVVKLVNQKSHVQFIYSDEDKLDYDGKTHVDPFFKPDWSPDYLRSINYITHFAVLKKSLIDKIGGFRVGTEGAQDWDLFLRATFYLEKNIGHCHPLDKKSPIQHIPTILYSWRKTSQSTASKKYASTVKNYAYKNQKKVLEDDLKRRGYEGWVEPTKYLGLWRVRYKIIGNPLVSIIIPTKDKYEYISRCLNSIVKKTTYKNYELIIVDTGSTDKKVWQLYEKIRKELIKLKKNCHSCESRNPLIILRWQKPFNFSSVSNFGAEKSRGEYLLFLNNDTEIITPDWIEGMLEHGQRRKIGAVGCKLLYPDGRIQHAGVILGIKGGISKYGIAGHSFKYFNNGDNRQFFQQLHSIKNYSAVTAACLLIKKQNFINFDPEFRIAFNDVDFNLRLLNKKYFNLYTPFAILKHYESISVGKPEKGTRDIKEFKTEILKMYKKWKKLLLNDPFYNKNLSKIRENYDLNI
jgi:glycosyltransferase involved in cell wall biosynthesis